MTQVLMLLRLAPEIQECILDMSKTLDPPCVSERSLRPIAQLATSKKQLEEFRGVTSARS